MCMYARLLLCLPLPTPSLLDYRHRIRDSPAQAPVCTGWGIYAVTQQDGFTVGESSEDYVCDCLVTSSM